VRYDARLAAPNPYGSFSDAGNRGNRLMHVPAHRHYCERSSTQVNHQVAFSSLHDRVLHVGQVANLGSVQRVPEFRGFGAGARLIGTTLLFM
jgi:hypothetical protein